MKKRGRKPKKPPKDIFKSLYENNQTKAKDLAKIYGVKEQTIYNWNTQFRKEQ